MHLNELGGDAPKSLPVRNRYRMPVGGVCINSLSYADDMVLLAPTVKALLSLLEVCGSYSLPHDIVYKTTKTVALKKQTKLI